MMIRRKKRKRRVDIFHRSVWPFVIKHAGEKAHLNSLP